MMIIDCYDETRDPFGNYNQVDTTVYISIYYTPNIKFRIRTDSLATAHTASVAA